MIAFFPQPFPVDTELGQGFAVYVESGSMWGNDTWCVALDDGRLRHFLTSQLLVVPNGTYGLNSPGQAGHTGSGGATAGGGSATLSAAQEGAVVSPDPWQSLHEITALCKANGMPAGVDAMGWLKERIGRSDGIVHRAVPAQGINNPDLVPRCGAPGSPIITRNEAFVTCVACKGGT
jgi:hypothetical protein